MHIHIPKAFHSLGDLVREIAIIVIGVIIALAAEQWAQRREWHHKVEVAKAAMLRELLEDDGPQIYQRAAMHPCVDSRLKAIRDAVERRGSRAEINKLIAGFWLPFLTFDSLSHDAATAGDVASHMSPEELANFSNAYAMMPRMDRTNTLEAADSARLHAVRRSGGRLSEAEASSILSAVEALKNEETQMLGAAQWTLPTIRQMGQLDTQRLSYLMKSAHKHYGDCVKDLPPNWPF